MNKENTKILEIAI